MYLQYTKALRTSRCRKEDKWKYIVPTLGTLAVDLRGVPGSPVSARQPRQTPRSLGKSEATDNILTLKMCLWEAVDDPAFRVRTYLLFFLEFFPSFFSDLSFSGSFPLSGFAWQDDRLGAKNLVIQRR